MSHKSRNLKRRIENEWKMLRNIRQHKNVYSQALNLRIVFSRSGFK